MRNRLDVTGCMAVAFIGGAALLFVAANFISYLGNCSYDDLSNTWSCASAWTSPVMSNFDTLVLLIAYPALFIGILFAIVRLVRGK